MVMRIYRPTPSLLKSSFFPFIRAYHHSTTSHGTNPGKSTNTTEETIAPPIDPTKSSSSSSWPPECSHLNPSFATKLNVYKTMAHHPKLLNAWAPLRDHLVVKSALNPQQSEVVILRTGVHLKSDYELQHHISRARACGMDDERIRRIIDFVSGDVGVASGNGTTSHGNSENEDLGRENDSRYSSSSSSFSIERSIDQLLCQSVDELCCTNGDRKLSEDTLRKLLPVIHKEGVFDLMATVGFYSTLGFVLNTFQVPLDEDIVKEMMERPFVVAEHR